MLAQYFADKDKESSLARLFEGPTDLTEEERRIAKDEEGWILGVPKDG